MKSLFSQSALFFPQFWVFEAIFEARGQNFLILKNSVCIFYCTQNDRLDPTISMQKSVWKTDHPGPRYSMFRNIFANVSAHGCPFIKPIFALKPWDQDGCFECNKMYKQSFLKSENFACEPQKWPQKPKIAGKIELIGKKGFSFRYLWHLNW